MSLNKPLIPKFQQAVEFQINGLEIPAFRFSAEHAENFFSVIFEAQESDRIELKAMSCCGDKKLLLVLSFAPGSLVHVEVDCKKLTKVPSLRAVWPVASWWEDELERVGELSFTSEYKIEGVKWPL